MWFSLQGVGKVCTTSFYVLSLEHTIVIIPTISLILDQAKGLGHTGLRVTYLGSVQKDPNVLSKIAEGHYDIVLTTPESFFDKVGKPKPVFLSMSAQVMVGLRHSKHSGALDGKGSRKLLGNKMRAHLLKCADVGKLTSFPKHPKHGENHPTSGILHKKILLALHCTCRKPYTKENKMAACSVCGFWFHQACHEIPGAVFRNKDRVTWTRSSCH